MRALVGDDAIPEPSNGCERIDWRRGLADLESHAETIEWLGARIVAGASVQFENNVTSRSAHFIASSIVRRLFLRKKLNRLRCCCSGSGVAGDRVTYRAWLSSRLVCAVEAQA